MSATLLCCVCACVQVYTAFITKVHQATSRLQLTPSSAEEFAEYLEVGHIADYDLLESRCMNRSVVALISERLGLRFGVGC